MNSVPGQINLDNVGGRALFELVQKDTSIKNIVDIGSWNGIGTTLCCVLGAISRPIYQPVSIISLETNTEFYNIFTYLILNEVVTYFCLELQSSENH